MRHILLFLFFCSPLFAEKVTIYRDEWGVPHIYAETLEGMAYANGYAQAEDRLEEMLRNFRKAEGTMSEVFGESWFRHDYRQRLWRHRDISREKYDQTAPRMRKVMEAFVAGVKAYMKEHPDQVPWWATDVTPSQVLALGRFIIWGWPEGEAGGDLRRANIPLDDPSVYRGSNEWLVAANKSALKAPFALIDPHLSWYGEFRFYEVRLYAEKDNFAVSGASILGQPIPALGHSRWASVAMTTGGPDTADIFEEELNPQNPRQYMVDGKWRDLATRKEKIAVRKCDKKECEVETREVPIDSTGHGPIIAHKGGKAYAVSIPYSEEVKLGDQVFKMMTARNLDEMKSALGMLQLMAQNIMVGTVQGDIYYQRTGRVPVRAKGTNPSLPIPGNKSANDWQGLHPMADLVQITNPPQGYMQNCNISPAGLMKDSPLTAERYATYPYIFNDTNRPNHQRAAMAVELLSEFTRGDNKLTLDQAIDVAFNTQVFQADRWQERVRKGWENYEEASPGGGSSGASLKNADSRELYELIQAWNRRSDPDSMGATAFRAFKLGLGKEWANTVVPPANLTDNQVVQALSQGASQLKKDFGALRVPYGQIFRVARQGGSRTYPVGGGSLQDVGMATPRAIGFAPAGKEMVGRSGQTSTQLVVLSNPPKSWSVIPLGESDNQASGHWDDQAEKLFSKGKMKSTYFMDKKELLLHVTAQKVLEFGN